MLLYENSKHVSPKMIIGVTKRDTQYIHADFKEIADIETVRCRAVLNTILFNDRLVSVSNSYIYV